MAWRDTLIKNFGPGFLGGIRFGDFLRVLRQNSFAVAPDCWLRALGIGAQSLQVSSAARLEELRFGKQIRATSVDRPLFVLGHWRSGTTHLHNLLALDSRFGYPNNYHCLFPHAFLSMERSYAPAIGFFLPPRRPMDNIEWNMQSAQEDEFALANMTGLSPCLGWVFPRNQSFYDRFLTFQDVPEECLERWRAALRYFLQKLSFKLRKPLVLKSPPHTARIRLLLEMFPQARFVHIHRDPYEVFSSSRNLFISASPDYHRLQASLPEGEVDAWILRQYTTMHDAYFEHRSLIPAGQLHELAFHDLERDPLGQMSLLYSALSLPDFAEVEPELKRYVASIDGYSKNHHSTLPPALRGRIADAWQRSFQEWGYAK